MLRLCLSALALCATIAGIGCHRTIEIVGVERDGGGSGTTASTDAGSPAQPSEPTEPPPEDCIPSYVIVTGTVSWGIDGPAAHATVYVGMDGGHADQSAAADEKGRFRLEVREQDLPPDRTLVLLALAGDDGSATRTVTLTTCNQDIGEFLVE